MAKTWDIERYKKTARQAAAEGSVLLKNEDNALPLKDKESVAVFGRNQLNYYKSGTGSGGAVNVEYTTDIFNSLKESGRYDLHMGIRKKYEDWVEEHPFDHGFGWASEPWCQEEMPLDEADIKAAANEADTAIVIIGRTAGEDQDNKNESGSYLLTELEDKLVKDVCASFKKTIVVLNTGNILDMKWMQEYKPAAVLYVWQGGQEGGNAAYDILSGEVNPSGKLTDTIAFNIEDYSSTENFGDKEENVQKEDIYLGYRYFETFAKDKVMFPFGFGLSYTTFEVCSEYSCEGDTFKVDVTVKNTGAVSGKEVVQVYVEKPQGKLGNPSRALVGFAKTKELAPAESETLTITFSKYDISSYDDSGVTGHKSAYVLEEGAYRFYAGTDVRSASETGCFENKETVLISQCEEALAPTTAFDRMKTGNRKESGEYELQYESVPLQTISPKSKRDERLPECAEYTGDKGIKLKDVVDKKATMEEFLAQLSDDDLCTLSRGEGMCSPKVTAGIAGAFGGVTESLKSFGIPIAGCSDGPSGIRMDCGTKAFLLPNGTCLASSFNEELIEELYRWEGLELRKNRIDALLGPGMNIHRNPLNGRNFEYFSEDPFLTGKIAIAMLKGMHEYNVTGVIKHFAGNTQETNRHSVNSVASERALREIYLKGFEMAVKEGNATAIMSTYGPVNGIWTSGSYDLLTAILRGEWGFKGIVMTDWWAKANDGPGMEATLKNTAAQQRAQNDINMVNADAASNSEGDNLAESLKNGNLTRAELVRNAANICEFVAARPVFEHSLGIESELDKELKEALTNDDIAVLNKIEIPIEREADIDTSLINMGKGDTTIFNMQLKIRGVYAIEFDIRSKVDNELAQMPLTIFQGQKIIKMITLTGADTEWQRMKINLDVAYQTNSFFRFYIGQAGLEFRNMKLVLVEDWEEKLASWQEEQ